MKQQLEEFPLDIKVSFHKVIEQYKSEIGSVTSSIAKANMENILKYASSFPKLTEGINDLEELTKHQAAIKILLDDLFPSILTDNEIKAASIPFHDIIFNASKRFKSIINNAGEDFQLDARNFDENLYYIYACIIIIKQYYKYPIDFSRPLYYDIPDEDGLMRHYRIAMNADFIDIEPTDRSIDISKDDIELLIQNYNDIDLWKSKFPPKSWILKGFTIVNLTDVTIDDEISNLKTTLLSRENNSDEEMQRFQSIFRSIFGLRDLRAGFTAFNKTDETLSYLEGKSARSYILDSKSNQDCGTVLCESSYKNLVEDKSYFTIVDVDKYAEATNHNLLSKNLLKNNIKSCILAPIAKNGELLGILELVSDKPYELNSINAIKLEDILPYIVTAVERNKRDYENRIKAVIQNECTSIHPSVHWVFEQEAKRFIEDLDDDGIASFRDIAFEDVYPLYGQIDIVGSSDARNDGIQRDLDEQLNAVLDILELACSEEELPIYEQLKYKIIEVKDELSDSLNASTEQNISNMFKHEIKPLFKHLSKRSKSCKAAILEYRTSINPDTGLFYHHRKDYDLTVERINKNLARYIDNKQLDAQKIYPHYFERYKTDGVDHNIYIGNSMTQKNKPFDELYLSNLRLWQLSTMCEMENRFYRIQESMPLQLDAASLILVFSSTLSIRYRMDEKKFDIDGAYNARYEIIKKRIDKAFVKNTEERVTQKGKIAIVYTQDAEQREYLSYIKFLQRKKYLGDQVEILELEDVQGVVGLKAIRVNVLYTSSDDESDNKSTITYEELMQQLD